MVAPLGITFQPTNSYPGFTGVDGNVILPSYVHVFLVFGALLSGSHSILILFAVHIAGGATEVILRFGNKMRITIHRKAIADSFAVAVISKRTRAGIIRHLRRLTKVVVAELTRCCSVRVRRPDMQPPKLLVGM